MRRHDLKQVIQLYSKIEHAIVARQLNAVVKKNGRERVMPISSWMYKLPDILSSIDRTENNLIIKQIIEKYICFGKKDRVVMQELPVSESTYYRLKSRLIDKIYELLILFGEVTVEEILSNKIE